MKVKKGFLPTHDTLICSCILFLELLRSENAELKPSTAIGQKVGVCETELRRCKETISELLKKVDDSEEDPADAKANS